MGEESNFEFKYIPNLHTVTEMGDYEVSGVKVSGIERRNLKSLVTASLVLIVLSYVSLKTTFGILESVRIWWIS